MTDIVQRLHKWWEPESTTELCQEAAAEIEWLRKEYEDLWNYGQGLGEELEQLRANLAEYEKTLPPDWNPHLSKNDPE